jgi:CopG family transcriptional regulator, nickel-responsive regulator
MSVVRFGVSLEQELLDDLDEFVKNNRFTNRSQAIRQLIADYATRSKWECNNNVVGSITLIYNHHKRELLQHLNDVQHDYHSVILASQHFHLNHDNCMEIIAVKGEAVRLTELADRLIALKGIQHGKLTMSRET